MGLNQVDAKRFLKNDSIKGTKVLFDSGDVLRWKASDSEEQLPVLGMIPGATTPASTIFSNKAILNADYSAQNYVDIMASTLSGPERAGILVGRKIKIMQGDQVTVAFEGTIGDVQDQNVSGNAVVRVFSPAIGDSWEPGFTATVEQPAYSDDRPHMMAAPTVTGVSEQSNGLQTKAQVEQKNLRRSC